MIARGDVEYDAKGRAARLPGVVLDVTTQKVAESALSLSESRLQLALYAGRMGTWEIDLALDTMQCSAGCKANYGRQPGEPFTYADLRASVHEADRARWTSTVQKAVTRAESFEIEYRAVWPDNSVHWVYVCGSTSKAPSSGNVVALSGVSTLIDEKKRVEESLRAARRALKRRSSSSKRRGRRYWSAISVCLR